MCVGSGYCPLPFRPVHNADLNLFHLENTLHAGIVTGIGEVSTDRARFGLILT